MGWSVVWSLVRQSGDKGLLWRSILSRKEWKKLEKQQQSWEKVREICGWWRDTKTIFELFRDAPGHGEGEKVEKMCYNLFYGYLC